MAADPTRSAATKRVNVPLSCRLGFHDKRLFRWDVPGLLLKWRCRRCWKVGTRYV